MSNARLALGFVLILPLIILGSFQDLYVGLKQTLSGSAGGASGVGVAIATMPALLFLAGLVLLWREVRRGAEPS